MVKYFFFPLLCNYLGHYLSDVKGHVGLLFLQHKKADGLFWCSTELKLIYKRII